MADRTALMRPRRREEGQAAMEFVLALVWIIALAALLFQALHFERDVFNKMNELRYKVFRTARQNQETTKGRMIDESIDGETIGQLTPLPLPAQDVDSNLHYGPKRLYVHCGTKYWFPGGDAAETAMLGTIYAGFTTDHAKIVPDWMGTAFGEIDSVLSEIPCS